MLFDTDNRTIIACSTGFSTNNAIAIIRISGEFNLIDFQECFSIDLSNIKPRYAHYCELVNNGEVLDSIVLTFFEGPNSYNGESILELGVHGNTVNIKRIIDFFTERMNLRHAKPGEFTYRALKNKKLNLAQVEGLDLFLNSNSAYGLNQGTSLMNGELNQLYSNLLKNYLNHKSALELGIDFLDDVGEESFDENFSITKKKLLSSINEIHQRVKHQSVDLITPKVSILGKPNAGKSSFFNNILQKDRAIVSKEEGTTRDYISENVSIKNNQFQFLDTAGIRETESEIEKAGIKSSLNLSKTAFFRILVINPLDEYDDSLLSEQIDLLIFTHLDHSDSGKLKQRYLDSCNIRYLDVDNLHWEASKNEELFELIFLKYQSLTSSMPILLPRHIDVISNIYDNFQQYVNLTQSTMDIAILSSELNLIGHLIEELIGIVTPDDVLSNIFNNFCIGK